MQGTGHSPGTRCVVQLRLRPFPEAVLEPTRLRSLPSRLRDERTRPALPLPREPQNVSLALSGADLAEPILTSA